MTLCPAIKKLFLGAGLGVLCAGRAGASVAVEWWAYQPLSRVSPPAVQQSSWARTPLDQFILAKLEARSLAPAADADRATLLRRVYFDLLGLPPQPEEIQQFLDETDAQALERLIDRLLQRPQFGERWGRHWLDVARFAESVTLRGLIFKEAWRYRDYVIDAFNRDLPFDQFVREQVAGDLMPGGPLEQRQRRLVATTFLMLGNWNLEEQDKAQLRMDVVDEQVDTIGKAFLAQTLGCARCHDHKFDPVPTRDYYALAGILQSCRTLVDANVSTWVEVPLPLPPSQEEVHHQHEERLRELEAELKEAKTEAARLAGNKPPAPPAPVPLTALAGLVIDDAQARRVGNWRHSQHTLPYLGDGYLEDMNQAKGAKTLTFQPEQLPAGRYQILLAYTSGGNRARRVPVTILSAEGETTVLIDEQQKPPIDGHFVSLGQFRFEQNGQGFVMVSNEGTDGHVVVDAVLFLSSDQSSTGLRPVQPAEQQEAAREAAETVKRLETRLKELRAIGPRRPMVMTVREEKPADTHVHRRGSVHNLGEEVPRGFWSMIPGGDPIPQDQSGRLQLADWLAGDQNPLTARVMVNRVWHWLFGAGLVRSVDNFGTTGDEPSHPELLDYLAHRFVREGWSTKRLVRDIMLSRVYQLSSAPHAAGLAADPENRLCWRMNRRRVDAEALRDTMLAVSGELQLEMGGSTIRPGANADYGLEFSVPRRSIYVPVLRNSLPELFQLFDFADPSMVTGARSTSTGAPQALYLMNHPFVIDRASQAARRLLSRPALSQSERITHACLQTLGRAPTPGERALAQSLLQKESAPANGWAAFYQALFASLDFRYLH